VRAYHDQVDPRFALRGLDDLLPWNSGQELRCEASGALPGRLGGRGLEATVCVIDEVLHDVRRVRVFARKREGRQAPGVNEYELGIVLVRETDCDTHRLLRAS
jgi:hypothetical protein